MSQPFQSVDYSRFVRNIDPVANDRWIAKMMLREKYQPKFQVYCLCCPNVADELSNIYIFWSCDHWMCLECVDYRMEIQVMKIASTRFRCPGCTMFPNYPEDEDRDADIRIILAKDSYEFSARFSRLPYVASNSLDQIFEEVDLESFTSQETCKVVEQPPTPVKKGRKRMPVSQSSEIFNPPGKKQQSNSDHDQISTIKRYLGVALPAEFQRMKDNIDSTYTYTEQLALIVESQTGQIKRLQATIDELNNKFKILSRRLSKSS